MDGRLIIDAACAAAQEVFTTMLGLDIASGEAYVEEGSTEAVEGIVALSGVAGPWVGTGIVTCSPSLACRLASAMLMAEYESVNWDVLDAVAEIANMIVGNLKTALEEHAGTLGLSVPTVLLGRNFSMKSVGTQSWTVIPFQTGSEQLQVRVCLTPNKDTHPAPRAGFIRAFAPQY
jgi:chemotaxis protein CheX